MTKVRKKNAVSAVKRKIAIIKERQNDLPSTSESVKMTPDEKEIIERSDTLNECLGKLHSMGIQQHYKDFADLLLEEKDKKKLIKLILNGIDLSEVEDQMERLLLCAFNKVENTMDVKAADFDVIQCDMEACLSTDLCDDEEKNAGEYLKEFGICEKLLMIAQRKNIENAREISEKIGSDVDAFIGHFFSIAYQVLTTWQYDDVKFYEEFAYEILSQFHDLYEKYQLDLLLDIADLYIKHGDHHQGDVGYAYILRDSDRKDYIYYRFASIYETIDKDKAKTIAYSSLRFINELDAHYLDILDIIQR